MVIYYVFLFLIFVVYILFAYDLTLRIDLDFNHIKIRMFYIPIFVKKGKKYYRFLKKMIPKNQNQLKEEVDLSSLITLIHFKKLSIEVKKNIVDYLNYIYLVESLNIINNILIPIISENVENYHFKIDSNLKNNIYINSVFSFNIGIILINYLIIKRRYRHV